MIFQRLAENHDFFRPLSPLSDILVRKKSEQSVLISKSLTVRASERKFIPQSVNNYEDWIGRFRESERSIGYSHVTLVNISSDSIIMVAREYRQVKLVLNGIWVGELWKHLRFVFVCFDFDWILKFLSATGINWDLGDQHQV